MAPGSCSLAKTNYNPQLSIANTINQQVQAFPAATPALTPTCMTSSCCLSRAPSVACRSLSCCSRACSGSHKSQGDRGDGCMPAGVHVYKSQVSLHSNRDRCWVCSNRDSLERGNARGCQQSSRLAPWWLSLAATTHPAVLQLLLQPDAPVRHLRLLHSRVRPLLRCT